MCSISVVVLALFCLFPHPLPDADMILELGNNSDPELWSYGRTYASSTTISDFFIEGDYFFSDGDQVQIDS